MSEEIETIDGFDIPKRELTPEEAARPITKERIDEFHRLAGEDFCDQGIGNINVKILGGYLMAKYTHLSAEILDVCNDKHGEPLGILHLFYPDKDIFYEELASFINLTVACKARVNQVLIQLAEHYGN